MGGEDAHFVFLSRGGVFSSGRFFDQVDKEELHGLELEKMNGIIFGVRK